jgi:hypothetical protein
MDSYAADVKFTWNSIQTNKNFESKLENIVGKHYKIKQLEEREHNIKTLEK